MTICSSGLAAISRSMRSDAINELPGEKKVSHKHPYPSSVAGDQRGLARRKDGNGDGKSIIDIGAFEK